jgi:hypothetical protein
VTPTTFDLCLAWNWEYDADFVALLAEAFAAHGNTLLQVTPANLATTIDDLAAGRVAVRTTLDRASESEPAFLPLDVLARERGARRINPQERSRIAADKSAMHRALFALVRTPYTIVLPPHAVEAEPKDLDLAPLGPSFTIKPAHGGGGEGVVQEARTLAEVLAARRAFPDDEYLLQTHLVPAAPGGRMGWFRVIHCTGEAFPCWWDTTTHVYAPVTPEEEAALGLSGLRSVTAAIARVCGLRLFSTEIALLPDGGLVVVDYTNDPIDLRLQSRCREGVPDAVVRAVVGRLRAFAAEPKS